MSLHRLQKTTKNVGFSTLAPRFCNIMDSCFYRTCSGTLHAITRFHICFGMSLRFSSSASSDKIGEKIRQSARSVFLKWRSEKGLLCYEKWMSDPPWAIQLSLHWRWSHRNPCRNSWAVLKNVPKNMFFTCSSQRLWRKSICLLWWTHHVMIHIWCKFQRDPSTLKLSTHVNMVF